MLNEDYSTTEHDVPLWVNHRNIEFKTMSSMMEWVSDDKLNFNLSDTVYTAMVDCLENNIDQIIVATIVVENQSSIDVMIRRPNFQKILSSYIQRLLNAERYEKLAEIKKTVEKYDLEI
jgi:hypothetical protein